MQTIKRLASPIAFGTLPGNSLRFALLLLLTVLVYSPVFRAGFGWDDDIMLTRNALVQGGLHGLRDIWFTTKLPDYFPLTSTSLWVEWRIWGIHPLGYHATNLLLHLVSALLIWRVFVLLGIRAAWVIALLFAVHPVNVQAVAWIAERKDTLSLPFYLLSIWAYLRFEQHTQAGAPEVNCKGENEPSSKGQSRGACKGSPGWPGDAEFRAFRASVCPSSPTEASAQAVTSILRPQTVFYLVSLAAFLLALLSKTSVVMLPLVLLGIAWWRHGRIDRSDVVRVVPFLALALVFGLVTIWFQFHRSIGSDIVNESTWSARVAGAGWNVWFYLYKAVLPVRLAFIYPHWEVDGASLLAFVPDLALLGTFAVLWRARHGWGRAGLVALGYFVITLFPVLGFLNIYFHRFSFVADHYQYVSMIGILGLFGTALAALGQKGRIFTYTVFPGVVLILCGLSWQQCALYQDTEKLWTRTLELNPRCWLAYNELGGALVRKERLPEAEQAYRRAVELCPLAQTYHSLGSLCAERRDFNQAFEYFRESLRLDGRNPGTHSDLATALVETGRIEEGEAHFRETLHLSPGHPVAAARLAPLLIQSGKASEALTFLEQARQRYPGEPVLYLQMGNALMVLRRPKDAAACYHASLQLNPNQPEALNNLAWLLATASGQEVRDGPQAVALAQRLCALAEPNSATYLDTLGAAYAEAGHFGDAIQAIGKALTLAEAAGQTNALAKFRTRLQLYEAHKPYRAP